jgi:hypothetical protein
MSPYIAYMDPMGKHVQCQKKSKNSGFGGSFSELSVSILGEKKPVAD